MEDSKRGVLRGLLQYVDKAESESGAAGENTVDQVVFFSYLLKRWKWSRAWKSDGIVGVWFLVQMAHAP